MSAQDNKQLVMDGYQKFQNRDIPALLELFADDVEWIDPEVDEIPFSGNRQGKAAVGQYFAEMDQAQEAQQFEPGDCIAEGDKVVVTGQSRWTVRSTGQTYESSWVHIFFIRDGKVARFQLNYDTAAAAKAFRQAQASMQQPGQAAASTVH